MKSQAIMKRSMISTTKTENNLSAGCYKVLRPCSTIGTARSHCLLPPALWLHLVCAWLSGEARLVSEFYPGAPQSSRGSFSQDKNCASRQLSLLSPATLTTLRLLLPLYKAPSDYIYSTFQSSAITLQPWLLHVSLRPALQTVPGPGTPGGLGRLEGFHGRTRDR